MRNNPLISIIVPVYNTEKYLEKCIESILSQSYDNIEILIVNDGSNDNSAQILEKYKSNLKIKIFEKKNEGLALARKLALENSKGEYICFVDSDDYIDKDYCKKLYENMINTNSDISMCRFVRVLPDIRIKNSILNDKIEEYSKFEAISLLIQDKNIQNYVWDKMFKKHLFEGVNMDSIKFYEDFFTTKYIFEKANKLSIINEALYFYTYNPNSITSSMNKEKAICFLKCTDDSYIFINKYKDKIPNWDKCILELSNKYVFILRRIFTKDYKNLPLYTNSKNNIHLFLSNEVRYIKFHIRLKFFVFKNCLPLYKFMYGK